MQTLKSRLFGRLFLPLAMLGAAGTAAVVVMRDAEEVEFRVTQEGTGATAIHWLLGPTRDTATGDRELLVGTKTWSRKRPAHPGWIAVVTATPTGNRTKTSCIIKINGLVAPLPGGAQSAKPGEIVTCVAIVP